MILEFANFLEKIQDLVFFNFLGGPKICQMKIPVNIFKCFTFFYIVFLMYWYQNFSTGIYVYLALHGSYGLIWLFKDIVFGDKTFENRITIGSMVLVAIILVLYWLMPWFIASGMGIQEPSLERINCCIFLYLIGIVLMIGGDAQKNFTLQYKKGIQKVIKGLISQGFFSRVRNPNYLGEIMIYGSFGILTGYWLSYLILISIWCSLFMTNIIVKDYKSLRKKEGWTEYQQRSYMLLPRLVKNNVVNIIAYSFILVLVYFKYMNLKYSDFQTYFSK